MTGDDRIDPRYPLRSVEIRDYRPLYSDGGGLAMTFLHVTLAALTALGLVGCSTTNVTNVTEPSLIDASTHGDLTPEAGIDGATPVDAGVSDTGVDADEDATCFVTWIPPGWSSSDNCGSNPGSSSECPPCLPYEYQCSLGSSFPGLLAEAGAVMSGLTGDVCSNLPLCVRATSIDTYCASLGPKTQGYVCAELTDGAAAPDPLPGCIDGGFVSQFSRCCP